MIEIPEWLAKLPKNACVNSNEFSELLGIKLKDLHNRLERQNTPTPKPDFNTKRVLTERSSWVHCRGRGKSQWRAVTVRNHIRHLNRLELEKSK